MNRLFITALAVISIMFAFVGCPQSEPKDKPGSDEKKTTPITTSTTIPGTRISASSLAELQTQVDAQQAGSVIDLSQCYIEESGSLTINKAMTVRNFESEATDITVSSGNVTLTGLNVNNVSTSGTGSTSLKIANSSLANLTLGGNSANSNIIAVSRAVSPAKITFVNSSVSEKVTFNESVEMDVIGFSANIAEFECSENVSVAVNMTESALAETNKDVQGITFTSNISDDQVFAQTEEYGPAGGDKTYTSATFPSSALKYVSRLVGGYVSGTPSFPIPSFKGDSTSEKYEYSLLTAADMGDELSAINGIMTFDFRALSVIIPDGIVLNKTGYESALKNAGFNYDEDEDAYIYSNMDDLENMYNSDNPSAIISALNNLKNKKFYRLQVSVYEDYLSFSSIIMEYNFNFQY